MNKYLVEFLGTAFFLYVIKAVGNNPETAIVFMTPGKYCTADCSKFKPKPAKSETAIIIMFMRFIVKFLNKNSYYHI